MIYSLLHRVRGTFLGAFLGEVLSRPNVFNLGTIAVVGTESLISLGGLDVDDWLKRQQQAGIKLETNINSWGKIILATLPVAIFFHDDIEKMRVNILEVQRICNCSDEVIVRDASLIIGYAIAQSLNQKLNPFTLISETINFLGETSTYLPEQLIKVNHLLKTTASLDIAVRELSSPEKLTSNIGLAIYCFLSTLEDFSLTVLRASRNHGDCYQNLTSAIAGALSGAYNTTMGIPVNWQISASISNSAAWGLENFTQISKLSDKMIAVWAGVYDWSDDFEEFLETRHTIFAAPHIIRRR
ncbi:MAG: ADP-ribosylglycohydrolase family protein [Cuspidothrix sp.]